MVKLDIFLAATFAAPALISAPDLILNVFRDMSASLCLFSRPHRFGYCVIQIGKIVVGKSVARKPASRKIKWFACSLRLEPFFGLAGLALPLKAQSMRAVLEHDKVIGQASRTLKINAHLFHPENEFKTRRLPFKGAVHGQASRRCWSSAQCSGCLTKTVTESLRQKESPATHHAGVPQATGLPMPLIWKAVSLLQESVSCECPAYADG